MFFGNTRPNLDSIPSNIGKTAWYPPTWSGFEGVVPSAALCIVTNCLDPDGRLN